MLKKKDDQNIQEVMAALEDLNEDQTIPKNVKLKLSEINQVLQESSDAKMRINKALQLLDDISNDTNLEPYTRTQLWSIVSLLEKV